jgi:hypothetical protein
MKPLRTPSGTRWALPILLLTVAAACPAAFAQTLERSIACPDLSTLPDPSGRWTQLGLPGAEVDAPLGAPAVPSFKLILPLAPGAEVQSVAWAAGETQTVALSRPVQPQGGEPTDLQPEPPAPRPDAGIYASTALYPPEAAQLIDVVELSNGTRYAVVRVYPVRVRPAANEVSWTKRGTLVVSLGAHPATGLVRERAALPGAAPQGTVLLAEHGFAPSEVPTVDGSPIVYAIICPPDPALAAAWQVLADWKTSCGYPAAVFQTDWIDAHYPMGADQPERIRAFLRDAYLHWGLRWALIGADASLVPPRYVVSWAYSDSGTEIATDYYYACLEGNWDADGDGIYGESDHGTNVGDDVDLTPEIEVGRVSARTATDVAGFLQKYFTYTRTPNSDGYLDRVLLLGEVLFSAEWTRTANGGGFDCEEDNCVAGHCRTDQDGKLICVTQDGAADAVAVGERLRGLLGMPIANQKYLLERFEHWNADPENPGLNASLESSASVMEAMSAGYGLVHHMGHGDRDRWAVGDGRIEITRLASLTNGAAGHYFWAYGVNCNSAAIDFDSFGERLVLMPTNGSVAYIGCTNADFPASARSFIADFYDFLYGSQGTTIGDGHFAAAGAHALTGPQINFESVTRFLLYDQILLGDPGMPIWRGTPTPMSAAIVGAPGAQVPLGQTSIAISVTAGGSPVDGARVCVQKAGEVYAVALTGAGGTTPAIQFWPDTEGPFTVTVTAPTHRETVVNAAVTAATAGPALVLDGLGIVDNGTAGSAGNSNGRIELGETIRLALTVNNAGVASASNVQATLAPVPDTPAGVAVVSDADATLGTIAAGGTATDAQAFLINFDYDPPAEAFGDADLIRVPLGLTLTSSAGSASIDLFLELARPRIGISTNRLVTVSGQTKKLWIGVANAGQGTASHLQGRLVSREPFKISVSTPAVNAHDIAPGDTAMVGPFRVTIQGSTGDLGRLVFSLLETSPDPDDTLHTRNLDLRAPQAPDSLQLVGLPGAMRLTWKAAVDPATPPDPITGYKVYRAPAGQSPPFPDVVGDILEGHRYFTDIGLGQLSRYSYYVAAVDAGGNLGANSLIGSAYTSPGPSEGWPHFTEEFTKSSPVVCELDGATTRGREILFGAECLYAYHGDGSEMNDGDDLERTTGPFGIVGPGQTRNPFWGRPAAGDIDGDGAVEVVAISFINTSTNPDANARGAVFCWGTWGGPPRWVYTFPDRYTSWTGPVLADLNDDGKLEVIFSGGRADHAGIYVLKSDGTPFNGTNALLKDLGGRDLFQSPAVGDVDGAADGLPEIVLATRTSDANNGALWVLRANGTPLAGFDNLKFTTLGLAQVTTASPTLCNVDGTPGDEIFVTTTKRLWCLSKRGAPALWYKEFPSEFNIRNYELLPEPALGDVDGDGRTDVALVDPAGRLQVLQASTGNPVLPFPKQLDATRRYGSCILANVDQDPRPEIIFGDSKGQIQAYRFNGELAAGFPITFGGDLVRQSPAAWDVDRDGFQNLVLQANEQQEVSVLDIAGVPFATDEDDIVLQNPWPMRHRDARNTGELTLNTPVLNRIQLEEPEVSPAGSVTLAWTTGEPAAAFRIRRAHGDEAAGELVAEIPARASGERYTYIDTPAEPGRYIYHVNPVLLDGSEQPGPTVEATVAWGSPVRFGLQRVAPDPLTPSAVAAITFGIPGAPAARVQTRLAVFDVQGRRLRTLLDEMRQTGVHVVSWDGRDEAGRVVPAGLYLLRLQAQGASSERRVLVIR